jgi:hypothetical protein
MKYIVNKKDYSNEVNSLANFAQKRMGFSHVPKILFDDDVPNSYKTLGKTGYYDPGSSEIHIYASGRHIKDILRSLAHEFVHHMQNEKGDLARDGYMGQGYAQKNPKMREMEREAYEMGNLCFRDWEDSLKEKHPTIYNERRIHKMSYKDWKNKQLKENVNKKWGFSMNLDALNESKKKKYDLEENQDRIFAPNHYCAHHVIHEGKEGFTVDHNWNEYLGKVTRYDVKFLDGTVKRNIHESKLTVLEAFTEMQHKRDDHPAVKKDKDEKMEEKAKPDYIDLDKDGNKKESMKKAAADAKASKKPKKKEKEEKEEKLEEGGNKRVMELADQHDVSNEVAQSAMTMMNKGKSEKEAIKMAKRKHAGGDKKKKDMKESLKRKIRVRIKK